MKDYNLKFICKKTGETFFGKTLCWDTYAIFDHTKNEEKVMHKSTARDKFKSHPDNRNRGGRVKKVS